MPRLAALPHKIPEAATAVRTKLHRHMFLILQASSPTDSVLLTRLPHVTQQKCYIERFMSAPNSIFVRACKSQPVERTPVWFMRQAGRYMAEYRAVRKQHSLLEICKKPALAAEVTVTAAEILGVDAAIIFADLLLPLEVMGLPFHFSAGEGPVIEKPVRSRDDIIRLRQDRAAELGYVSEAVALVAKHFTDRLPVIGFCGAPFTLASYMIEGGGSRNYVHTKKMMYNHPSDWDELMRKLVAVTAEYSADQVLSGADAIQIFDSWVGCLSVEDYRRYVLAHVSELVSRLQKTGAPIIYFSTDSATLLPAMQESGADVIGLDWRIPLNEGWSRLEHRCAVQGNLDPVLLFAEWKELKSRAEDVLHRAGGRPGHIFNLGHGILPETPVENVKNLARFVKEHALAPGGRYSGFGGHDATASGHEASAGNRAPEAGRR
jgi:uroporphyrinogen decarboxylase